MARDLTIAETLRELKKDPFNIDVERSALQKRCAAGKVPCRRTPEGWYLIPESKLKVVAESFKSRRA